MCILRRSTFLVSTFTKFPSFTLKKYHNNLINISKFATFSINNPKEIYNHVKFQLDFDSNKEEEKEEMQSILFDPQGPYADLPKYKRAPAPKVVDLKYLTQLEKNVFVNPYASIIGSPIRQCIYHQRWFPQAFLVRFIRAYDKETSSVWIVPDFMEEGGIKRPGRGYWIRCNANILQNVLKEGKYKAIYNKAYWRKDMHEHVWKILVEDSILRFDRIIGKLESSKFPMKRETAFLPIIKVQDLLNHYHVDSSKPIPGLQCILMLDDPSNKALEKEVYNVDGCNESEHFGNKKSKESLPLKILSNHVGSIEKVSYYIHKVVNNNYITQDIPSYYVKTIWGDEGIRKIKNYLHLKEDQNPMIGVIYAPQTKQLAISLWKLRNYWQ